MDATRLVELDCRRHALGNVVFQDDNRDGIDVEPLRLAHSVAVEAVDDDVLPVLLAPYRDDGEAEAVVDDGLLQELHLVLWHVVRVVIVSLDLIARNHLYALARNVNLHSTSLQKLIF